MKASVSSIRGTNHQLNFGVGRLPSPRGIGRRETTAQRDAAACTRNGAKSIQGPIAHHLSPIAKILAPASVSMVSAEAWDEASDLAKISA